MPGVPIELLQKKIPVKWGGIGEKILLEEEKIKNRLNKQKIYRKHEYSELDSYKELNNSGRLKLESFERAYDYLFSHIDMRLGYMQKNLIDLMKISFLRKMFGDDLVSNLKYLKKKYLITELNDTLAILFRF